MAYFIGIDGGGTKTKCVLTDDDLHVKFHTESGPSHFLTIGTDIVSETIINLIKTSIESQNISLEDVSSIVLGTTGAGRIADAEKLDSNITHTPIPIINILLFHIFINKLSHTEKATLLFKHIGKRRRFETLLGHLGLYLC